MAASIKFAKEWICADPLPFDPSGFDKFLEQYKGRENGAHQSRFGAVIYFYHLIVYWFLLVRDLNRKSTFILSMDFSLLNIIVS